MNLLRTAVRRLRTLGTIAWTLLRRPRCLTRVLDPADQQYRDYVDRLYGLGHGLPTVDILDLLPGIDETIEPYSFLAGTSLPMDLVLLKGLARRLTPCRYLEIGSWRGESLANVAAAADQCTSISLSKEELRQMGLPNDFVDVQQFFSRGLPNTTHIEQNSQSIRLLAT